MREYGQFCPVSKAAEILDQRWVLLVVREMLAGSNRFNDIHRGVPRMSRTLLAKRLRTLARAGIIERQEHGEGPIYELTPAGRDLEPVVDEMGRWGIRWMGSLAEQDLDPALLVWDMHRRIDRESVPDRRTVVRLRFPDVTSELSDWWLVLTPDEVDVCEHDPGYGVDVVIETAIRTMVRVWRGDIGWADALRDGLQIAGPEAMRRQVDEWFRLSHFAPVPRVGSDSARR